jgi:hypothetical protein
MHVCVCARESARERERGGGEGRKGGKEGGRIREREGRGGREGGRQGERERESSMYPEPGAHVHAPEQLCNIPHDYDAGRFCDALDRDLNFNLY